RSVALCDTGWRMNRATLFPKIWLDCTAQTTMYRYAGRGAVTRTTLRELPTLRASPTACNPPAANEGKRSCPKTWRGRHGPATPAHRTTDLAPTAICGVTDRAVTRETDGATRCARRRTDFERRQPSAYHLKASLLAHHRRIRFPPIPALVTAPRICVTPLRRLVLHVAHRSSSNQGPNVMPIRGRLAAARSDAAKRSPASAGWAADH